MGGFDAAASYAIDEGAEDIVLFGDSMGAGVISAFLQRSDLTPSVRAMVFDAPMVDFSQTVDDNAAREPLIGPIDVPPTLTWTAKWLTELRFDVDWEALDYLDDPSIYDVPTLVLHGTDDLTIPIGTSEQLASAAPDTVTLIEMPGGRSHRVLEPRPRELRGSRGRVLGIGRHDLGAREPGGALRLERLDLLDVAQGQTDVVEPFHQAPPRELLHVEDLVETGEHAPSARRGRPGSRVVGSSITASIRARTDSSRSSTGRSPIFKQLFRKMSANDAAMIARKP